MSNRRDSAGRMLKRYAKRRTVKRHTVKRIPTLSIGLDRQEALISVNGLTIQEAVTKEQAQALLTAYGSDAASIQGADYVHTVELGARYHHYVKIRPHNRKGFLGAIQALANYRRKLRLGGSKVFRIGMDKETGKPRYVINGDGTATIKITSIPSDEVYYTLRALWPVVSIQAVAVGLPSKGTGQYCRKWKRPKSKSKASNKPDSAVNAYGLIGLGRSEAPFARPHGTGGNTIAIG